MIVGSYPAVRKHNQQFLICDSRVPVSGPLAAAWDYFSASDAVYPRLFPGKDLRLEESDLEDIFRMAVVEAAAV